jgi:hypothetical protein
MYHPINLQTHAASLVEAIFLLIAIVALGWGSLSLSSQLTVAVRGALA